jgi:signal transduction histidine kinase
MSLKLKLSLLTAGLLTAAVGVMTAAMIRGETRALSHAAALQQEELVGGLAEVCRGSVMSQQDLLLTNYLKRLKDSPAVAEASCQSLDGKIIGHTDVKRIGSSAADVPGEKGPGFLALSTPVKVGAVALGEAKVLFRRDVLDAALNRALAQARDRIIRISWPVLAAGFLGAFLAVALALRSVGTLVQGVRTVADGKLDHRLPEGGGDELGWLAREFNRMAEKLGELDRLKQDFVHGITHDLKSPLSAVKAATDLVQTEAEKIPAGKSDAKAVVENLHIIRQNTDRLMNLITSVLEVANIESGLSLRRAPARLEEIADRVVKSFSPAARAKGIDLDIVVGDDLRPLPVDEGKLERAVANLVGNALKFTEKGAITVTVARDGGAQTIRVEDSGPGLPPELAGRLFSKFARGERPGGKKIEGSGLGLSIVKGIVEAHGGAVAASPRPEGGTLFTISLPEGESA